MYQIETLRMVREIECELMSARHERMARLGLSERPGSPRLRLRMPRVRYRRRPAPAVRDISAVCQLEGVRPERLRS